MCRLVAYQFDNTFLGFPENVRMGSVDHSGAESITVIVIAIWLRIMANIIFWVAGVPGRRVRLLYARIYIRLHVVIRIRFVTQSVCLGEVFEEPSYGSRSGNHLISCPFRSYCNFGWFGCYQVIVIAIRDWLLVFTLPWSCVQTILFKDKFWV